MNNTIQYPLVLVVLFCCCLDHSAFSQDIHLTRNPDGASSVTIKPSDEINNNNSGINLFVSGGSAYIAGVSGSAARAGGDLFFTGGNGFAFNDVNAKQYGLGGSVYIYGGTSYSGYNTYNSAGGGNVLLGYNPYKSPNSTGNIGIATNNPSEKLEVKGNVRMTNMGENNLSSWGTLVLHANDDSVGVEHLLFKVKRKEQMRLTDGGNLGIGIQDPFARLSVSGNAFIKNGGLYLGIDAHTSLGGEYIVNTKQTSANVWGLSFFSASNEVMRICGDRVHIGTQNIPATVLSNYKLWVQNGIASEDLVIVNVSDWKDNVFQKDYSLQPLENVATFISQNKHLQGVPSEEDVKKNGYSVVEFNKTLLQKIEELTLYLIEQDKKIKKLENALSHQSK